ncbi:hypothetical protein N9N67_01745 [Bacteriovoracaceae bacterium]|nr:hypothetical protein [Bacteriovoracaceae bacterium]
MRNLLFTSLLVFSQTLLSISFNCSSKDNKAAVAFNLFYVPIIERIEDGADVLHAYLSSTNMGNIFFKFPSSKVNKIKVGWKDGYAFLYNNYLHVGSEYHLVWGNRKDDPYLVYNMHSNEGTIFYNEKKYTIDNCSHQE